MSFHISFNRLEVSADGSPNESLNAWKPEGLDSLASSSVKVDISLVWLCLNCLCLSLYNFCVLEFKTDLDFAMSVTMTLSVVHRPEVKSHTKLSSFLATEDAVVSPNLELVC